ncbi:hypothetical protein CEXT_457531 [Caerostris extrusa]|uniref:Uncharacterized protein n=1 Tax=Caerostris extrusa TaxID=172846 RepID=A0AAV4S2T6_CAEEX|nr:hypothetical protein CEXT_457531 [Caerostris extrusa]
MQEIISEIIECAIYVSFAGQSLNLVGREAIDCCLDAVNFSGIVREIYNFFLLSTHRWIVQLLFFKDDSKVPKSFSKTALETHSIVTSKILHSYDNSALHRLHSCYRERRNKKSSYKHLE